MGKVQTQENVEVETQTQETCRPTCRQGKSWTWKHTDMGDTDAEIHEHGNIQSWQHTEWEHADVGTGRCRHQNKTLTKQCFQAVCKDLLFQCNLFYCILFFKKKRQTIYFYLFSCPDLSCSTREHPYTMWALSLQCTVSLVVVSRLSSCSAWT